MTGRKSWICGLASGILIATTGWLLAGGWDVSVGPVYRGAMSLDVEGSSHVQAEGLRAGQNASHYPSSIGPQYQYGNRTYDDGFVFMDPGTDYPGTLIPGQTWYWGYASADQVDPVAETLTFTARGGSSSSSQVTKDAALDDSKDVDAAGVAVSVRRGLKTGPRCELSLVAGMNALFGSADGLGGSTYSEDVKGSSFIVRDVYDISLLTAAPAAPYEGTYLGPGPIIPNIPASRQRVSKGSESWTAVNDIEVEADYSVMNLSLGMRMSTLMKGHVSGFVQPAVTLNLVELDVDSQEAFMAMHEDGSVSVLNSWSDSADQDKWILGAGLSVGAEWMMNEAWRLGLMGGYDWVSEDVDVDVGAGEVSFDASGFTVGLSVGRSL